MKIAVRQEGGFTYIEEGEGEVLLLLHGLFGALSNWEHVVKHYFANYRVIIPVLPIYDMPLRKAGIEGLVEFVEKFVAYKKLPPVTLLGNSLGGHVGLVYTLKNSENVKELVLTGSSGLFENSMGGSFPKRGSYDYVKERVGYTFYDPATATDDLIEEVFQTTKSIPKCMNIVNIARSAQRNNLAKELVNITQPTLLVWGLNDTITPPQVAHEFARLMPNSTLRFIDKCCHAPMMEHPDKFNKILDWYLQR